MGLKFCEKCHQKVEQYIMECPECQATSFVHRDPTKSVAELELEEKARERIRSMNPSERKDSTFYRNQHADLEELRLSQVDRAMGPKKLAAFKERLEKELLELEYLEWRSLQPGWKNPEMQQRLKNISTTAAGVAIGTSLINSHLRGLGNEIEGENGEGVLDWIGDIFS